MADGSRQGAFGDTTIDATARDLRPGAASIPPSPGWAQLTEWAEALATVIGREQPSEHVAIFIPHDDLAELRLAAQIWGAGEDVGQVIVGEWVVPFDGSICGRVYRTGRAALCADVAMDPDYRSFPGSRTRSSLTVPVGSGDDVVAVINIEAPWVSAFSVRDYERVSERAASALGSFPGRNGG